MLFAGNWDLRNLAMLVFEDFVFVPELSANGCSCVPCVPPDLIATHP
jgi:hypothetical protein